MAGFSGHRTGPHAAQIDPGPPTDAEPDDGETYHRPFHSRKCPSFRTRQSNTIMQPATDATRYGGWELPGGLARVRPVQKAAAIHDTTHAKPMARDGGITSALMVHGRSPRGQIPTLCAGESPGRAG